MIFILVILYMLACYLSFAFLPCFFKWIACIFAVWLVKVSVFDSVVQGGDAVWEGLRVYDGKVFKLNEHLDRLVSYL